MRRENPPGGPPLGLTEYSNGQAVCQFPAPRDTAEFLVMDEIVRRHLGFPPSVATLDDSAATAVIAKERERKRGKK